MNGENKMFNLLDIMQKIVFNNQDGKPKPELAKRYTEIISSSLSELKCPLHDKPVKFELIFSPPDTYLIQVFGCCPEFKSTVEKKISLMLN